MQPLGNSSSGSACQQVLRSNDWNQRYGCRWPPSRHPVNWLRLTAFALHLCLFAALAGCGGGGSSDAGNTPLPSPGGTDTTAPSVAVTSPGTGSYSTSFPSLTVSGTASDDVGVTSVTWSSSRGGGGVASGTVSWTVSAIALQSGMNVITIAALDTAGNRRDAILTVTYNVTSTPSLGGQVDSSRVNRNGVNAVYVYNGTVTPNDLGSATPPVAVAAASQSPGSCLWNYSLAGLTAGTYTVAFTNQADADLPGSDDAIVFIGAATVTIPVGGTASRDFSAARVLRVGLGRAYTTPSAAVAAAQNGDVIEIDAGEYPDDIVVWRQNDLTLRGIGGRAHLRATRLIPYAPGNDRENGMAIWVTKGARTVIENIEFSGARVADQNGAGIRAEGPDLTICNGYFHDNENGILSGAGEVLIEYSEFDHNGLGEYGRTHNMYLDNAVQRFTLRHSYSHRAHIGHNVKSRAQENYILYNRIMDEADGTASYAIDLPDAGRSYVIGNLVQQGLQTDNTTILSYGAEGGVNPAKELYVANNTFVNDLGNGAFLVVRSGTTAQIVNNLFVGGGTVLSGPGTLVNNLATSDAGLVDRTGYDYRLTAGSAARDAGSAPGSAAGYDLTPVYHYVHKATRELRPADGALDIGAYEYGP